MIISCIAVVDIMRILHSQYILIEVLPALNKVKMKITSFKQHECMDYQLISSIVLPEIVFLHLRLCVASIPVQ